jgi:membrane-associated phospholipid phosphatase
MTDVGHVKLAEEPISSQRLPRRRMLLAGRVGLVIYFVVLLGYCVIKGIPLDRIGQTGWIIIGILIAKAGQPWREQVRTFLDWIPLLAALVIYDFTRGIADTLGMPVRVGGLVGVERWLFDGHVPTVWLQDRLMTPSVRWWDIAITLVYFSHFILPWLIAAAFYIWSRQRWNRYIRRVLLLSYAGLLTYVLLPAAPPWYAAATGEISDPVYRLVGRGWNEVGLRSADAWLTAAQAGSNQVAALPSLHAGFSLLVALTLWPLARHWALRVVLALYPLAMAFSLIYGGEHYGLDVLVGWLYVVVVMWLAYLWERWRGVDSGSMVGRSVPQREDVSSHRQWQNDASKQEA